MKEDGSSLDRITNFRMNNRIMWPTKSHSIDFLILSRYCYYTQVEMLTPQIRTSEYIYSPLLNSHQCVLLLAGMFVTPDESENRPS